MIVVETAIHQIESSVVECMYCMCKFSNFVIIKNYFNIKTRRCGVVANRKTLHNRQHGTYINNYRLYLQ